MNLRLPAVSAIVLGLAAAVVSPLAWPVAVVLGLGAAVLAVIALARRPVALELGLAIGGLVLGVAGLALGAIVGLTGDSSPDRRDPTLTYVGAIATATPDEAKPPQRDIESPLPCRVEIGALRAAGKITNNLQVPADYTVIVVWEDEGKQIGRNTAFVGNVPPSLSRTFEVSAAGEGTSRTICRVVQIDRVPIDGAGSATTRQR